MMVGNLEEVIADATATPDDLPVVVNDFDIEEDDVAVENKDIFLAKVEKRIREYDIKILNQPRDGKKLLVLDIDYTLFDGCILGKFSRIFRSHSTFKYI
ncbi:ubiquitin-like domain-containing CTD phosphatase 1 [Centruroides sculpturatus]|uniref:ubiquitin-like domain-containing CTD phosphatase 1 n=1 Tax=Centruroides sculpturatus TaxID=218467 RepID=UPI000C6EBAE6|nr:ubiquitin-like domain-containing CTD phosphatase 1 [Centruroides sculpturatus]